MLLQSLRLAAAAQQPWAVHNAAAVLWNAYLPILQQKRAAQVHGIFSEAMLVLLGEDYGTVDTELLLNLTQGLATAAEHTALLDMLQQQGEHLC